MTKHAVNVVDDLSCVVVGNLAGPSSPDTLRSVHQHHWEYRNVPLWLHLLVVIVKKLKQVGVHGWEQQLGQWTVREQGRKNKDREKGV